MKPKRNPQPEDGVAWSLVALFFVAVLAMVAGAFIDHVYNLDAETKNADELLDEFR